LKDKLLFAKPSFKVILLNATSPYELLNLKIYMQDGSKTVWKD